MRSKSEIYNKAYIWSMVTNRYWERDTGSTSIPRQAPMIIESIGAQSILEEYEKILLFTPSGRLPNNDLNQTSWYCEPLSILLWALNLIDFPEQSDGVGLGIANIIFDEPLENITLRSKEELFDALATQFWIYRRVYAFLNGVQDVDLSNWIQRCGQLPDLLKLCANDLQMYDGQAISQWKIEDLSYDYAHINISKSRLKALMWVFSALGYEEQQVNPNGIPMLPLQDTQSAAFTQWNHAGKP